MKFISNSFLSLALITGSALFTGVAHAGPWSWMTKTAISKFTPEDLEIVTSTTRDALNNQPDDAVLKWSNPNTGHSGAVKVVGTRELNGETCRTAKLANNAKTIVGTAEYFLCQQADGRWRVTTPQE